MRVCHPSTYLSYLLVVLPFGCADDTESDESLIVIMSEEEAGVEAINGNETLLPDDTQNNDQNTVNDPIEMPSCYFNRDCADGQVCLDGECTSANESEVELNTDLGDFFVSWEQATSDPFLNQIKDYLSSLQTFENLANYLNYTYILPTNISIIHKSCGVENAFYDPNERSILMCYELYGSILNVFSGAYADETNETLNDYTLSTWIFIFFHELGHAFSHIYSLPITGQEEDAVDDFSTVLLIEAGMANIPITAAYYWYISDRGEYSNHLFADTHSLNIQRFYNILCLVYGYDQNEYGFLLESFPDLVPRSANCPYEFYQKSTSWTRLLEEWKKPAGQAG